MTNIFTLSGTQTYDKSDAPKGQSGCVVCGGTTSATSGGWNALSITTGMLICYFKIPGTPSVAGSLMQWRAASQTCACTVTTAGVANAQNGPGTTNTVYGSLTSYYNQWLRGQLLFGKGTTTSNGTIGLAIYQEDSLTPLYTPIALTNANTGIVAATEVRCGRCAGNFGGNVKYSCPYVDDGMTSMVARPEPKGFTLGLAA